jgi:N-acetylglutamate synthase-like GNAT family acetyltransferase
MIRPAQIGDAPRIVELVGHFIQQTRYRAIFTFQPAAVETLVVNMLDLGVIFVAETWDAEIVGMVAGFVMTSPIDNAPIAEELAWWVEPSHRRSSIGPKLLKAFEAWAREQGAPLVKMVAPAETDVGAYYRRMGYVEVETAWVKRL